MKLPKHHYIPVFYLKQWATDGKVTAFRRLNDKVVATPKSPSLTGYVRGLYWLEGAEPGVANRIETLLMSPIDNNAAIAHRMILNDEIQSLPKVVRLAWSRFIVGLLIRSPATVKNIYDRMSNPTAKEYKDLKKEFERDFPGRRYEDIPPLEMKRGAMYSLAKLMQNAQVEDMLNSMMWTVYDLGLPELRFFTSDRPVIMTNGLAKKDGHLALPISPRKMFFAFANKDIAAEIKGLSPWHIADQANHVVIRSAIEVAWDTNASRLPYVARLLSLDAADDRRFFGP